MKKIVEQKLNELKKMSIWEYVALIAFMISIVGIVYFNFSDLRYSLDADFAITVYHGREMVNNRQLFLDNWFGTTSLEFDNTLLLAVPFCFLTHNMFLSVGISDTIFVLLYIIIIWNIFHVLKVRNGIRFMILAILLTPYNGGWLDYFKMLFFAHANYSVKALIPVLLLLNLLAFADKKEGMNILPNWKKYFFLGLYLILLSISTISTGMYTIVCGVVPIVIVYCVNMWKKSDFRIPRSVAVVLGGTFVASLASLLVHKKVYDGPSPIPSITLAENFKDNFLAVLEGMFRIFGALTDEEIPVYSILGLYYCLKIAFVFVIIVLTIVILVKWIKSEEYDYSFMAVSVLLLNMLILVLGDMRGGNNYIPYRYLLVGVPILLVAIGLVLDKYVTDLDHIQGVVLMFVLILAAIPMLIGNIKTTKDSMMNKDYAVEMTDYFKTLDVDSVFIVNDMDTALLCKAIDSSKKYAGYDFENNSIFLNYNYYYDEAGFDYYGEKNIIAIPNYSSLTDFVSEDIAQHYEYVGETRWLACYYADKVYFDQ